jgi:hypothetical protein
MGNDPSINYLTVMILGILAALASLQSLPDINQKKIPFRIIFYVGILTQIATQVWQYSNAAGRHVDQDRQFAYALFAYTLDNPKLLREFASDTPYVIGYRLFKDGDVYFDKAKPYFYKSIERGQFVASSYYILATIERMQNRIDLTAAKKLYDKSINSDKVYAGAYYGRALTEVKPTPSAALEDLRMALRYEEGDLICLTINMPEEVTNYWGSLAVDDNLIRQFKQLQASCMPPPNNGGAPTN